MTSLAAFSEGVNSDGLCSFHCADSNSKNNLSASAIIFIFIAQGLNATGDPRNVGCEVQTAARQVPF